MAVKRLGTVLAFKEGVSETEAKEALDKLAPILEPMYLSGKGYHLTKFDPDSGWPVFYIP